MKLSTKKLDAGKYAVLVNGRETALVIEKGDPPKYRQGQEWCIGVAHDGHVHYLVYDQKGKALALETIAKILAAAMSTRFSWLIEAPGARYLGVRHVGRYEFYWTEDHAKALRLGDETQADLTMMAVRDLKPDLFAFTALLGDAKAVEHGWMEAV